MKSTESENLDKTLAINTIYLRKALFVRHYSLFVVGRLHSMFLQILEKKKRTLFMSGATLCLCFNICLCRPQNETKSNLKKTFQWRIFPAHLMTVCVCVGFQTHPFLIENIKCSGSKVINFFDFQSLLVERCESSSSYVYLVDNHNIFFLFFCLHHLNTFLFNHFFLSLKYIYIRRFGNSKFQKGPLLGIQLWAQMPTL